MMLPRATAAAAALLLAAVPAVLAQESAAPPGGEAGLGLAMVKMIAALALVLGLLLAGYWAMRRFSPLGRAAGQGGAGLRTVGRLSLGGKAWLQVVQAGGRVLILGVTEHSVNLVATVDDPEEAGRLLAAGPASFGRALKRAVGRGGEDDS